MTRFMLPANLTMNRNITASRFRTCSARAFDVSVQMYILCAAWMDTSEIQLRRRPTVTRVDFADAAVSLENPNALVVSFQIPTLERLGRNDPCPWGSGHTIQAVLSA